MECTPESPVSIFARESSVMSSSSLYHVIVGFGNPTTLHAKVTEVPSSTVSVAGSLCINSGAESIGNILDKTRVREIDHSFLPSSIMYLLKHEALRKTISCIPVLVYSHYILTVLISET